MQLRSPWPWLIGIIILGGFLWFILTYKYVPENKINNVSGLNSKNKYKAPIDTTNEVNDFINFSKKSEKQVNPKRYAEKGIIKLQSALSYLADRVDSSNNSIIDKNIDSLDISIAKADTSSTNYLSELKPAFFSALKVMASIQKFKYPQLAENILNLKNVEKSINEKFSLDSQLTKIIEFYFVAGNTIERMKSTYAYN